MEVTPQHIARLLLLHLSGELNAHERHELEVWMQQNEKNSAVAGELLNEAHLGQLMEQRGKDNDGQLRDKLLGRIQDMITADSSGNSAVRTTMAPVRKTGWGKRWQLAAAVALAAVLTGYWLLYKNDTVEKNTPTAQQKDVAAPDKSKATITLADGSVVYLDSAGNGQLAQQGNIQLIKLANGQITYRLSAAQAATAGGAIIKEMQYNTLSNPRGSKVIDMQLADGSHVWLNAGSSITYPVAFTGNERNVALKGEGYFEVAKDPAKKFIVTANGTSTEVLGTRFNVNAYEDEADVKVTLLEGSVRLHLAEGSNTPATTLKPGQQAAIHHSSFIIHHSIDTEQVMSWKNGYFSFTDSDLPAIMRQMSCWYGVDVKFETVITDRYTIDVPRTVPVSQLFKYIEMSGGVHFEIKGTTIIVKK